MDINNRFGGVYAKDQLTYDMIKNNKFYIINLDDLNSPRNGTHWTALLYNKNKIEYFDSYGLTPLRLFLTNNSYTYNSSQIHSYDSKACGYFCLYFIYHLYHDFSYYNIMRRFSLVDFEYNQIIIKDFFNNYN